MLHATGNHSVRVQPKAQTLLCPANALQMEQCGTARLEDRQAPTGSEASPLWSTQLIFFLSKSVFQIVSENWNQSTR